MLGKVAAERLIDQEKLNKQLSQESKELKHNFSLALSANLDLEKKVAELEEALKHCQARRKLLMRHSSNPRGIWRNCKKLTTTIRA
jgi:hypothetical protein